MKATGQSSGVLIGSASVQMHGPLQKALTLPPRWCETHLDFLVFLHLFADVMRLSLVVLHISADILLFLIVFDSF